MGNWRVIIVIAVAVALGCWGTIILLDQQDKADAVAALNTPHHHSGCIESNYTYSGTPTWLARNHQNDQWGGYTSRSACEAANPGTTTRAHYHYSLRTTTTRSVAVRETGCDSLESPSSHSPPPASPGSPNGAGRILS